MPDTLKTRYESVGVARRLARRDQQNQKMLLRGGLQASVGRVWDLCSILTWGIRPVVVTRSSEASLLLGRSSSFQHIRY